MRNVIRGDQNKDESSAQPGGLRSGNVRSYSEKLAAEKAAKRTFGVKGVANDIVVTPFFESSDSKIATTAVVALESRSNIPSKNIKVTVKGKFIYLDGKVDWKYQKDAAENAVKHIFGAKGVRNKIEIEPKVSSADVRDKFEEALRRSAELEARRLMVTSDDGTVEL